MLVDSVARGRLPDTTLVAARAAKAVLINAADRARIAGGPRAFAFMRPRANVLALVVEATLAATFAALDIERELAAPQP